MLLQGERPGIESNTKYSPIRYKCSTGTAKGVDQKLSGETTNPYRRESEEEKLVHARHNDRKDYPKDPSSKSRYRHFKIIGVGNGGPHFRVRTLVVKADQHVFVEVWIIEFSASDALNIIPFSWWLHGGVHDSNAHRNIRLWKAEGTN